MRSWHPDRVRRFRGQILTFLCGIHNAQKHRLSDAELCHMLQGMAISCGINDVVTCLQDMKERDWVTFRSIYNEFSNRTELSKIEIRPAGRDLVEQTTKSDAVLFW
jgi:hypothetical protein